METVGLIAALPQEIRPLLRQVGAHECGALGPFRCCRFHLRETSCLLVQSGMGHGRAVDATAALLEAIRPRLVVCFGVAGALQDDLRVGDVVVAGRVCCLDNGMLSRFLPLARLSGAAEQAAVLALRQRGARLFHGTVITTTGSQTVVPLPQDITHPVLEMETAGVARVAAEHDVPLLALRAVSDTVADPLPFSIEELVDETLGPGLGRLVGAMVRHPRALCGLLRLARDVTRAAANLAVVVAAALE